MGTGGLCTTKGARAGATAGRGGRGGSGRVDRQRIRRRQRSRRSLHPSCRCVLDLDLLGLDLLGPGGPVLLLLLKPLSLSLGRGDDRGDGLALRPCSLPPPLGCRGRCSARDWVTRPTRYRSWHSPHAPAIHGNVPILPVLPGLGELLEVLLGVGPDLHDRARLDEGCNLLPTLAVLL